MFPTMPTTYRAATYFLIAFATTVILLIRLRPRPRPPRPLTTALGLAAALGILLPLLAVDTAVLHSLQSLTPLTPLFRLANTLGEGKVVYPLLACTAYIAFTFDRPDWEQAAGYALLISLLTGLLVQTLQTAFMRTRPYIPGATPFDWFAFSAALENDRLFKADFRAFPSGHAATAFGAFLGLGQALRTRTARLLLVIPPALTALARVHFGRHWLSDTVASALVAAAVVTILPYPKETRP